MLTSASLTPVLGAAAKIISDVSGQAVGYIDVDRSEWVAAAVAGEYQPSTGRFSADFARRTAAAWAADETR